MKLRAVLFLLALAACRPPKPPEPPPGATCLSACANLVRHDCPAAKPTAKGASCRDVCENFQSSGIAKLNLACMSTAEGCAAIDACNP